MVAAATAADVDDGLMNFFDYDDPDVDNDVDDHNDDLERISMIGTCCYYCCCCCWR